jgi:hypothetical protein
MSDQIEELREKYPGLASRVDNGRPISSIKMFCLHCMGGQRKEVELCTCSNCPLYKLRLGRRFNKNTVQSKDLNEKS